MKLPRYQMTIKDGEPNHIVLVPIPRSGRIRKIKQTEKDLNENAIRLQQMAHLLGVPMEELIKRLSYKNDI